jgi:hypothetical protein
MTRRLSTGWRDVPTTQWERYWSREDLDSDSDANFTFGEVVWKAARAELLKEQRKRKVKRRRK